MYCRTYIICIKTCIDMYFYLAPSISPSRFSSVCSVHSKLPHPHLGDSLVSLPPLTIGLRLMTIPLHLKNMLPYTQRPIPIPPVPYIPRLGQVQNMRLEIMQISAFLIIKTSLLWAGGTSERRTWQRGNTLVYLKSRGMFVLGLGKAVLGIVDVARSFGGEGWMWWAEGALQRVAI